MCVPASVIAQNAAVAIGTLTNSGIAENNADRTLARRLCKPETDREKVLEFGVVNDGRITLLFHQLSLFSIGLVAILWYRFFTAGNFSNATDAMTARVCSRLSNHT